MAITLMSLGPHAFYVPLPEFDTPGYETLQRDSAFTWIPQGRLNAPVAMQYTGPGQDTIVIEGKLFPHHFGGISTLNALRESGKAGKPLTLIRYYPVQNESGQVIQGIGGDGVVLNEARDAAGNVSVGIVAEVVGDFVIMRVRSGEKNISSVGLANHIDFAIEITSYGNDTTLRTSAQAVNTVTNPTGTITGRTGS